MTRADIGATAAKHAVDLTLEDVPPDVRERARLVVLDTVGVCLRGGETSYVPAAADRLRGLWAGTAPDGGGTVLCTGTTRPPAAAALLNAAGGTSLELDEGNQQSGHPGIHTVPPALAVAEHVGASGREFLTAVIAGYEVGARLGDVIRPLVDGLHPHGGWAPVSGAVATGRLLGLDPDRLADAIRIAVNPFVATHWSAAIEGATVRDFYPGVCAAHGVLAAGLAGAGVTGVDGAVARCLLPYTAAGEVSGDVLDATFRSLGDSFYLTDSYLKRHAACRYTHAPIEALAAVERDHGLDPAAVAQITVQTFELGTLLDRTAPANVLAAKFSTPYALAARAVLGRSGPEAFTPELVSDPTVRELADRVELRVDPDFERRAEEGYWGAAVTVEFEDGTAVERSVRDARGGGDNPYTREAVLGKFDELAGAVLPPETVDGIRASLLSVDDLDDVRAILGPVRS